MTIGSAGDVTSRSADCISWLVVEIKGIALIGADMSGVCVLRAL